VLLPHPARDARIGTQSSVTFSSSISMGSAHQIATGASQAASARDEWFFEHVMREETINSAVAGEDCPNLSEMSWCWPNVRRQIGIM
jgi:hypothetical protein